MPFRKKNTRQLAGTLRPTIRDTAPLHSWATVGRTGAVERSFDDHSPEWRAAVPVAGG